jgi:hypothetical protein
MFERSQVKYNSLDYHFFWEYFSLIVEFTCSKFDTNKKQNYMCKVLKPSKWKILVFFKCFFFFYQMCAIPS